MKKILRTFMAAMLITFIFNPVSLFAQSDLFNQGTVWQLTFIKIKANMDDDYLKGLSKTWKSSMDMMVKDKLIKSYKVLKGPAANKADFDLLLMIETDNMASFDPNVDRDKKIADMEKRIIDGMGEEYRKTIVNYESLREITGTKVMREIFLK